MSPRSVLITGCNRGIGLGLVRHFLALPEPPKNLIVTCRDKSKASDLVQLQQKHSDRVHILELEVTKLESFPGLVSSVSGILSAAGDGDCGLNLLIHNAAVVTDERKSASGVTPEHMREAFEINTIAPLFLTKAMMPLIEKASQHNSSKAVGVDKAAVVFISTAVGSIAENTSGGNYAYRSSKTALNMVMKNVSIEYGAKGVLVLSVHPGWVKTDMGGPNALIDVDTCCGTMIQTLNGLTDKDHGTFLRYNNTPIPW